MTLRRIFAWVASICVLSIGCNDHNHYVVELTPRGDSIERSLSCWRISPAARSNDPTAPPEERGMVAFPADEIARIAKLYPTRISRAGARKHAFRGKFTQRTPADVGGAGSYARFHSPLGSTTVYCERFRGEDDLVRSRRKRYELIDEAIEFAIGWFRHELGMERGFDTLRAFLDGPLRRDLRVVSDYAWTAMHKTDDPRGAGAEFIARAGQYLAERGYFELQAAPQLFRAFHEEEKSLQWVQRLVAEKMGLDPRGAVPALRFLASPADMRASQQRYLAKSPQYARLLERWEQQRKTNPESPRPEPKAVVEDWWERGVQHTGLLRIADKVEVRLHCQSRPHETNGQWDERSRQAVWKSDIREGFWLPTLCFAAWSEPNAAAQREHFGGVVLAGESLRDYVIWYCGLTSEEAKEWDAFVESLRPDIHLASRLKSFQFDARPQTDAAKRLADRPRSLILQGMEQRKHER
jgi:hypothetical protein